MTIRVASIPSPRYLGAVLALAAGALAACGSREPATAADDPVARGKYLVTAALCNDCHTPMKLGPNGPERDEAHLLAGHPQGVVVPPPPAAQGPWNVSTTDTMTAWSGPWGVSLTANLTPDPETGLGTWDAQTFIDTIRNARHMGKGRPLLPPMPAELIATLTDDDLRAMFAYLRSIPPVRNRVPDPIAPSIAAATP